MNQPSSATSPSIRMGEMLVANDGSPLRTLLGSCVGLALYDARHRIGGLAHIVLPDSRGQTDLPGKFVDTAIPELVSKMSRRVGHPVSPTAKIAGGACMFAVSTTSVGQQNVEACLRLLSQRSIPILGQDCGGQQGRRMTLNTDNGSVTIEIVGQDPITL